MCDSGGGVQQTDNGAAEVARQQAAMAAENARLERERWNREEERIAKEKADAAERAAKEQSDREAALKKQQEAAAAQAAAQQQTGGAYDPLKAQADRAKVVASAIPTSSGLPGYSKLNDLAKKAWTMSQPKAAFGTTNTLTNQAGSPTLGQLSGFNYGATGGKKF